MLFVFWYVSKDVTSLVIWKLQCASNSSGKPRFFYYFLFHIYRCKYFCPIVILLLYCFVIIVYYDRIAPYRGVVIKCMLCYVMSYQRPLVTIEQVALEGNFRFVLDKSDLKSASDKKFVRKFTVALKNKICEQNTTPCFSALSSVN